MIKNNIETSILELVRELDLKGIKKYNFDPARLGESEEIRRKETEPESPRASSTRAVKAGVGSLGWRSFNSSSKYLKQEAIV